MTLKKSKRASLQDVADRVGTTRMTVSRALRNPESVSEPLRTQIAEAVEALNYVPNHLPMLMSQARSQSIGLLVPSVTNQVFSQVMAGVIDAARARDFRVMISHYGYDRDVEERSLAALLSYNTDGIVLSDREHTSAARKLIEGARVPVIEIMDTRLPALQQAVGYDNQAAGYDMTTALIAYGCRQIAYLAVRLDKRTLQREQGYMEAVEEAGLRPQSLSHPGKSSFSVGAKLMAELLEKDPAIDGIFCTNDDIAVGAFFECQRRGIAVPGDISIAGFHGLDVSEALGPQLATIVTPRFLIGELAAEQLIARVGGAEPDADIIDLGYEVVGPGVKKTPSS